MSGQQEAARGHPPCSEVRAGTGRQKAVDELTPGSSCQAARTSADRITDRGDIPQTVEGPEPRRPRCLQPGVGVLEDTVESHVGVAGCGSHLLECPPHSS